MRLVFTLLLLLGLSASTNAEPSIIKDEKAKPHSIFIELNSQEQIGGNCQVSFVMKNSLSVLIQEFAFELVIFNQNQKISKLLLLKSGELPKGKTRVKIYGLKAMNCNNISRFLVNDIKECSGENLTPKLCLQALQLNSRTSAKLGA